MLVFDDGEFPFVTGWMGENHFRTAPTALYGVVLLMAAIAYTILQATILAAQGPDSKLAAALGRDLKGKLSPLCYLAARRGDRPRRRVYALHVDRAAN